MLKLHVKAFFIVWAREAARHMMTHAYSASGKLGGHLKI
jgi:hypothetical protein